MTIKVWTSYEIDHRGQAKIAGGMSEIPSNCGNAAIDEAIKTLEAAQMALQGWGERMQNLSSAVPASKPEPKLDWSNISPAIPKPEDVDKVLSPAILKPEDVGKVFSPAIPKPEDVDKGEQWASPEQVKACNVALSKNGIVGGNRHVAVNLFLKTELTSLNQLTATQASAVIEKEDWDSIKAELGIPTLLQTLTQSVEAAKGKGLCKDCTGTGSYYNPFEDCEEFCYCEIGKQKQAEASSQVTQSTGLSSEQQKVVDTVTKRVSNA